MIFQKLSVAVLLTVVVLFSDGLLDSVKHSADGFRKRNAIEGERTIFAKTRLEERRNFFNFFNVPYIVCFFAAKGKWPFVPSFMQVQVDQVGRSIFPQSDGFIRNYCHKWMQIKECFRPQNMIPTPTAAAPALEAPEPDPENDSDVETFRAVVNTTPCPCAQQYQNTTPAPVVFFDKNYIGNVSSETIKNTIEFLESFLPPTTKKPKRKNKIRDRT